MTTAEPVRFLQLNEFGLAPTLEENTILVRSAYFKTVPARGIRVIETKIAIQLPPDICGLTTTLPKFATRFIENSSTLIVDAQEVKILMFNFSDSDCKISPGDQVAKIVLLPKIRPAIRFLEQPPQL